MRLQWISIMTIICTTYLLTATDAQVTFLDSLSFRPLYRALRDFTYSPLFRSNSGANPQSRQFNQKRGKLQRQFTKSDEFFCDLKGPGARSSKVPDSVHKLTPGDIDIIGAMGDSLSAGNGAMAVNYLQLYTENKGISFTAGGQETWREIFTLPNILKEYNPKLYGYAAGDAWSHHKATRFNAAEGGAMSRDMPHMAKVLITRIINDPKVDLKNHWKFISLMIGDNDFCSEICYTNQLDKVVEQHERDLLTVMRMIRDSLPRTFFNLIVVPSIETLMRTYGTPPDCVTGHVLECPCFYASRFQSKRKTFFKVMQKWQQLELEIVNREEFQNRTDFTAVAQTFTQHVRMPRKSDGLTDFTYMSYDCFHFSQKGYSLATTALWNNLLEPVGNKSTNWKREFEALKCPTSERPYLMTKQNS